MKRPAGLYRLFISFALLFGVACIPAPVFASAYGVGTYSSCSYDCPPPPTITTLPSGLQVAINLTSGQTIPAAGYTIQVTPLNGKGATIQKVEFSIDGQIINTTFPDSTTGTATWHWVPSGIGDVHLHVVIYGNDGSQTARDFLLHVTSSISGGAAGQSSTSSPSSIVQRIGQAIQQTLQGAIRNVPAPIVYSFPYMLFILLGILLLFFALQVRREIQGAWRLQEIVAHEQHIAKEKETFLQLSEHYLRTPITLIMGGAEALGINKEVPIAPEVVQHVTELGNRLRSNVEAAITRLASDQSLSAIPKVNTKKQQQHPLWLSTGFLAPVAGFLALLAITEYLVRNIRHLNVSAVNQIVQATIVGLLLVTFYQILRRRQLQRREIGSLKQTLQYERAVDDARNDFIRDNAQLFSADIQQLIDLLPNDPKDTGAKVIREGCGRLRKVVNQFAVASRLAVGQNREQIVPSDVADIFTRAQQLANKTLSEHHTKVQTTMATTHIYCRQPQWLPFVLGSLLDNAAMYSANDAEIELGASANHLYVSDHGTGIPADTLEDLFKPFVKGEGALEFNHQGLGFSLYLDKLIMTYLGGDISVESTVGKGTKATLLLPSPSMTTATVTV